MQRSSTCGAPAAAVLLRGARRSRAAGGGRAARAAPRSSTTSCSPARPAKSIEAARGRIAFDFTGDACEGYALSFRQVTQLDSSEGGPRTIDCAPTSFEAGDGASYRFKTESSARRRAGRDVDGTAEKGERRL